VLKSKVVKGKMVCGELWFLEKLMNCTNVYQHPLKVIKTSFCIWSVERSRFFLYLNLDFCHLIMPVFGVCN
jgi:hypothetical protein